MSFGFFPSYYKRSISTSRRTETSLSARHYLCVECDKEFILPGSLTKHTFADHQTKTNKEDISPVASKQDPAFENTCPLCSRNIGRVSFKRHMISDHDTDPYLCTRCNSRFNLYEELTHHRSLCKPEVNSSELLEESGDLLQKSNQCPFCPSVLSTEASLFAHVYCNHNSYPATLSCSLCPCSFIRKAQLGSHNRIHRNEFICGVCGRQCFYSEQLIDHTSHCRLSGEEAINQTYPEASSKPNGKPGSVV